MTFRLRLLVCFVGVFLICTLPQSAHAQDTRWLTLLGESLAAKRAVAGLAESGGPAVRSALSKLGIFTTSGADALLRLGSLSGEQNAALLLHDTGLGRRYLDYYASNPLEQK